MLNKSSIKFSQVAQKVVTAVFLKNSCFSKQLKKPPNMLAHFVRKFIKKKLFKIAKYGNTGLVTVIRSQRKII